MHLFKVPLSLAFLAASALAEQLTYIVSPTPGSTLTAGSQVTVQVGLDSILSGVDVVAIVIGLSPCTGSNGECYPASEMMGDVLYQGPFEPDLIAPGLGGHYENFTVTVPESITAGNASLNVLNLYLLGAEIVSSPIIEYLNQTVTVVA